MTIETTVLKDGKIRVIVEADNTMLSYIAQDKEHALSIISSFLD